MKNVRVTLPVKTWGSLNTKYRPSTVNVGDDEFTDGTKNVETNSAGVITAVPGGAQYNSTVFNTAIKDSYEAVFSDGTRHLLTVEGGNLGYSSGGGVSALVTAGYSTSANFEFTTYKDRVYFGNGITTQVYDKTTSYGGVTYTAPATKTAGCQAPATAVTPAAGASGNIVPGTYYYKVTYTYYGEQESNGGPASGAVTISSSSKKVDMTAVPVGGYGVTARNIYRSSDGVVYRWVGEILDNTTTTFTDDYATPDELIPTDNGVLPAARLLITHKDRLWMVGAGSIVYYTEAGLPDICMSDNFVRTNSEDPITALAVFYDRILVFNRRSMGQIVGDTPDTYAYQALPGNIGCVDNRSVQIRVIDGVPSLIWLAASGVYEYNGATVTYISDKIENIVNFNIQQATQVKGRNFQDTQADFQNGTASGGIDLTSTPGSITTVTPVTTYQTTAEWEGGTIDATVTHTQENSLSTAVQHLFPAAAGEFAGTALSGSSVTLTPASDHTGAGSLLASNTAVPVYGPLYRAFRKFTIPRAGILHTIATAFVIRGGFSAPTTHYLKIFDYDPFTTLGTQRFSSAFHFSATGNIVISASPNLSLDAGEYMIGVEFGGSGGVLGTYPSAPMEVNVRTGSEWIYADYFGAAPRTLTGYDLQTYYNFTQTAVLAGGTWTSAVHDSGLGSSGSITPSISCTGSYASGTSGTMIVETSATSDMASPTQVTLTNPTGTTAAAFSATERYWRVILQLSTPDDRVVPSVSEPTLAFPTTATWTSPEIDCTADVTAYAALVSASTVPSGTSVTLTAASATTSGGSYSSFTAIGSTPVRRYVKLRAVLVGTTTAAPLLTSLTFKRSLSSTLISSVIDCATAPAGWDIFQTAETTGGGVATWHVRTAASSGALSGASWVAVTPGEFLSATPLRYAQWRVTLTAVNAAGPSVQSVALNWFIATITSARVASLFENKTYYLAAATAGSLTNDIVLAYDWRNNWREIDTVKVGTLFSFYGDPYYTDAVTPTIVKWRLGTTNADGSAVLAVIRTKAYDLGSNTLRKLLRKLFVTVGNTGATWTFGYSIDNGATFKTLVTDTGATSVVTTSDGSPRTVRLVPRAADLGGAKTIMLSAASDGAGNSPAELHELSLDAIIRQGDVLNV